MITNTFIYCVRFSNTAGKIIMLPAERRGQKYISFYTIN